MKTPIKPKYTPPYNELRQLEADKTNRLRALRLAKEAADREAAARTADTDPPKRVRRKQPGAAPVE